MAKYFLPYIVKYFLKRFQKKFMNQNPHIYSNHTEKEGNIKINEEKINKKKHSSDVIGEYVDYEEIEKN